MNRFIAYSRKASRVPFLISIYRDYRTFSGYGAVAYPNRQGDRLIARSALEAVLHPAPTRKLSYTNSIN